MFGRATACGFQSGPTTGNIGGASASLSQVGIQALIDASLGGALQSSDVTTSGAAKSSTAFSFDIGDEGEESRNTRRRMEDFH